MITPERLHAFCPASVKFAAGLIRGADRYQINTPKRVAFWLANLAIESQQFTKVAEDLNYTTAERIALIFRRYFDRNRDKVISPEELAAARPYVRQPEKLGNFVYANRMGNGNALSGDGFRNRGQGLIGTTGHDNILAYSMAAYGDDRVLRDPTLLQRDPDAALSAAFFVHINSLNKYADADNFFGYCGAINSGNPKIEAHAYDDKDRGDLDTRMDWKVRALEIFR